jgi:hypothetical protein
VELVLPPGGALMLVLVLPVLVLVLMMLVFDSIPVLRLLLLTSS